MRRRGGSAGIHRRQVVGCRPPLIHHTEDEGVVVGGPRRPARGVQRPIPLVYAIRFEAAGVVSHGHRAMRIIQVGLRRHAACWFCSALVRRADVLAPRLIRSSDVPYAYRRKLSATPTILPVAASFRTANRNRPCCRPAGGVEWVVVRWCERRVVIKRSVAAAGVARR